MRIFVENSFISESLIGLGIEISAYVFELHDITKAIKQMDETLIKESTPENQLMMQEIINRYKTVVDKLRILLEAYFAEESKENIPTDFAFRKLYKKLKVAY